LLRLIKKIVKFRKNRSVLQKAGGKATAWMDEKRGEMAAVAGDIVRIGNNPANTLTYQFVASSPGATAGGVVQVLIGTDRDDTTDNLVSAISDAGVGGGVEGTDFGTSTTAHSEVTPTWPGSANIITLTAISGLPGREGRKVKLFSSSEGIQLSADRLQGGVDADEGKPKNYSAPEKSNIFAGGSGWSKRISVSSRAEQELPFVTIPGNTETVVIGAKTYTFQTTLTDSDGNVAIVAGDVGATVENLVRAINLTGTPGTDYATSMTKNADVTAVKSTNNILKISAISSGTRGNGLVLSATTTDGWRQVALEGGQDFRGSPARGELTFSDNPANTNTVSIDEKDGTAKVYTFQTTLTDVDGNVHIGATATDSMNNLINAINLGPGAGTDYATSMTLHNMAKASRSNKVGDIMNVEAKEVGDHVNQLNLAEAGPNTAWTNATYTGGHTEVEVLVDIGDLADTLGVVNVTGITLTNVPSDRQYSNADVDKIVVRVDYNEKVVYNGAGSPTVGLTFAGNNPVQNVTAGIITPANQAQPFMEFEYAVPANAGAKATSTFSIPNNNFVNNETITINSTAYTFKTTLTPANGEILIGASAADTRDNIIDAIQGTTANADVTYGAGASSPHPDVTAVADGADVDITAIEQGTGPNAFVTQDTITDAGLIWTGATMANGLNGVFAEAGELTYNGTSITLGGGGIFEADEETGIATAQAVPNDFTAGGPDGASNIVTPFNARVADVLVN